MGYTVDKKKLAIASIAALVLGGGIYSFYLHQDFVESFEPYQLKAYTTGLEYGLKRSGDLVASLVNLSEEKALARTNGKTESVPVLLYHGVIGNNNQDVSIDGYDVSIDEFKDQMIALKRDGWQTITLEDFYRFKRGEIELPQKSFLLTFDDGRKDSYYPVEPVLRSLNFNAVMFVITNQVSLDKSNYYLEEDELKKMAQSDRWEIESHGNEDHGPIVIDQSNNKGHFLSNRAWLPEESRLETEEEMWLRIDGDLKQSRTYLEELSGKPVIAFAFPFGDFGYNSLNSPEAEKTVTASAASLYPLSFYQADTSLDGSRFTAEYREPGKNSFFIGRIEVHPGWSGENLAALMNGVSSKSLPYYSDFNKKDEWLITWGEVNFNDNLRMEAGQDTGSMVILDGSRFWQNYSFKTGVKDFQGSNLYLVFRFEDDNNYAACNFGRDLAHVEETIDGERKVIKGTTINLPFNKNGFEVEVRVKDRQVECLYNGRVVVATDFLNQELDSGGIGLKGWDAEIGRSQLLIASISVDSNF